MTELLVVIAIIAVLAALSLTGLSYARRVSNERATLATIKIMESALERYETDFHDYPPSDGDSDGIAGAENLLECLSTEKKEGPYIKSTDVKSVDSNQNGRPEPADHWNQPIRYWHHRDYQNRNPNKRTFRMISGGVNAIPENGRKDSDDIPNWNKDKPEQ